MGARSNALAQRLEQGADALVEFAKSLTDAEWKTTVPRDGRTVGVCVDHVANVYPIEIELAQLLAAGKPIAGVTWAAVAEMNANHAKANANVTKDQAIANVRAASRVASAAVRALTDEQLDRAAPVSLNWDAPLTCQFFIEDHALRHSYHHLGRIKAALGR